MYAKSGWYVHMHLNPKTYFLQNLSLPIAALKCLLGSDTLLCQHFASAMFALQVKQVE